MWENTELILFTVVNHWTMPVIKTSTFAKREAWISIMEEEGVGSGTFMKSKRKQKFANKTCRSIHMKTVGELTEQETDCREAKLSFSKQGSRQILGEQNWSEKMNVFSRENECLEVILKIFSSVRGSSLLQKSKKSLIKMGGRDCKIVTSGY